MCLARLGVLSAHQPLAVRSRLCGRVPIWLDLAAFIRQCITPIPACRGIVRRLTVQPDVVQDVPDVGTVRDEGNDAHLPAVDGAHKRKYLVDMGDPHSSEVVAWLFGQCGRFW